MYIHPNSNMNFTIPTREELSSLFDCYQLQAITTQDLTRLDLDMKII